MLRNFMHTHFMQSSNNKKERVEDTWLSIVNWLLKCNEGMNTTVYTIGSHRGVVPSKTTHICKIYDKQPVATLYYLFTFQFFG